MTIQEALNNIDVVVSNARMLRAEHDALKESMLIITNRLQLANTLEKELAERSKEPTNKEE